ncbi:MAG TPA: TerC family protein [Sphingomonadales bacterium]
MLELLTSPEVWTGFITLTILEIVLGIDNLIFLSIVSQRLPRDKQPTARRVGLFLALFMRVALLFTLTWIAGLVHPAFYLGEFAVSWRDIVLGLGGAFLIYKGTVEIHQTVEGKDEEMAANGKTAGMMATIIQIAVLDLVFSLDSVITAVGMVNDLPVMVAAVVVAIIVMLVAAEPVAGFIHRHPTVKMLALSFLLLVGFALVADASHFHIPRGYLYAAIVFSLSVESLNILAAARQKRREEKRNGLQAKAEGEGGDTTP